MALGSGFILHLAVLVYNGQIQVFLLTPQRARQLYGIEGLYLPAHPVTASVLTTAIKETHCTIKYNEMEEIYDTVG